MQQLINAILKFRNALVFSVFLMFAVLLTSKSSSYHRNVFAQWSTKLTGWLHNGIGSFEQYINLAEDNQRLTEENEVLLQALLHLNQQTPTSIPYGVETARVMRNSYLLDYNYLTLYIGENQGVLPEMGVVSAYGIVGVIRHTTSRYAQVMSILNKDLQINAKLKKSNHFGSLVWEGENPSKMKLDDLPNTAPISIGDTVTTGGMSSIFPTGIPIGTVSVFHQKPLTNFYEIEVDLFQDMTDLGVVYVIKNPDKKEVESLEHAFDE